MENNILKKIIKEKNYPRLIIVIVIAGFFLYEAGYATGKMLYYLTK